MSSPTTNYGWTKPTINGDSNTWGAELNTDLDQIDAQVFANAGTAAAATAALSATLSGVTSSLTGLIGLFMANAAIAPWVAISGQLISRTGANAALWAYAQASGNITANDAAWLTEQTTNGGPMGKFSPGDGSTTFRLPDPRGISIRAWANGSSVDSGRAIGTFQADAMQGVLYSLNSPNGVLPAGATGEGFTGVTGTNTSAPVTVTGGAISDGTHGTPRIASETRPSNIAWLLCIHL